MSLFKDIMNIQTDPSIEDLPQEWRVLIKSAHRDARHEAAELVMQTNIKLLVKLKEFEMAVTDLATYNPDGKDVEELVNRVYNKRNEILDMF